MEFLALAALLVFMNEFREWRTNERHKVLSLALNQTIDALKEVSKVLNESFEYVSDEIHSSQHSIADLSKEQKSFGESLKESVDVTKQFQESTRGFITQAQVDLATIVNEYKINGIPLGYQRKPHLDPYDLVEGL